MKKKTNVDLWSLQLAINLLFLFIGKNNKLNRRFLCLGKWIPCKIHNLFSHQNLEFYLLLVLQIGNHDNTGRVWLSLRNEGQLTHKGRYIIQTTYSMSFSSMKIVAFWLKFHWKIVSHDPINNVQVLVKIMAGVRQATSHHLIQCWPRLLTHICVIRPQ